MIKDNYKIKVYAKHIKRPLEFSIALISLILLSPLFLIISLLVRIHLGTPIFFRQERPGLNEKIFTMYKFRTMSNETNSYGELLSDSTRLTKFGRILRSTSLDELPELLNIIKGDMAIIGPRPLLIKYLPYYREREKMRHTVRPGLTGLAQINGRNNLDWDNRLELDVQYVSNLTFILDLKIFLKTIVKILKREDVVITDQMELKDLNIERGAESAH